MMFLKQSLTCELTLQELLDKVSDDFRDTEARTGTESIGGHILETVRYR